MQSSACILCSTKHLITYLAPVEPYPASPRAVSSSS